MEKSWTKIIQICADSNPESSTILYALCENSTIWQLYWDKEKDIRVWVQIVMEDKSPAEII